jgi:hypothetical protein
MAKTGQKSAKQIEQQTILEVSANVEDLGDKHMKHSYEFNIIDLFPQEVLVAGTKKDNGDIFVSFALAREKCVYKAALVKSRLQYMINKKLETDWDNGYDEQGRPLPEIKIPDNAVIEVENLVRVIVSWEE